jgi:hypothetical protein
MEEEGVIESDEVDGEQLYIIAPEYRSLPVVFGRSNNRLAILQCSESKVSINYLISNSSEAWGFTITSDLGKVERLSAARLREICDTMTLP